MWAIGLTVCCVDRGKRAAHGFTQRYGQPDTNRSKKDVVSAASASFLSRALGTSIV
jgi:hypothetical protein